MSGEPAGRRRSLVEQDALLRGVIARTTRRDAARTPVVVFDLDGTVVDNRPRVAAILRALSGSWGARHPEAAERLARARPDDIVFGIEENLARYGVTAPELVLEGTLFWRRRFFADEFLRHDVAMPGAPSFVRACHEAGATVVYLTGRDLPNMGLGTFASLRELGFPLGVVGVELVAKPDPELRDAEFKRVAAAHLRRVGEVVASFENEPAHANLFVELYPASTAVLLDTLCAPHPPPLDARVEVISSFEVVA